jgi:purine-binding chemotaxis protein CheW
MGGMNVTARAESGLVLDALVLRSVGCHYAVPLASVIETMRPLPVIATSAMPEFVRGLAAIRGRMTPVVDVGALFGGASTGRPSRFVTLRVGNAGGRPRAIALAVEFVESARRFDMAEFDALPPLLTRARMDAVEAIAILDDRALLLLEACRILPAEVWAGMSETS